MREGVSAVVFVGGREGGCMRKLVRSSGRNGSSIHRMTLVCTYIRTQNDAVLQFKKTIQESKIRYTVNNIYNKRTSRM